jgi:hypothetical protein
MVVEGFLVWTSNRQLRFSYLSLKITTTVSWFMAQNQADYGLSVAPQKRREGDDVEHVSRSSGLLRVGASRTSVSLSGLKIGGDETTYGARGTIVEVTSSPS